MESQVEISGKKTMTREKTATAKKYPQQANKITHDPRTKHATRDPQPATRNPQPATIRLSRIIQILGT